MSIDPSDLSNQARRASSANNDMFDRLGDLGDSIDREERLIDDLEEGIEEPREALYETLEQMETDYRRVEAFADEMQSRQERQNSRLEDILDDHQESTSWNQPSWTQGTTWQTQPWGMYQQQGLMGQQQGFGWNNSFWSSPYQDQSQGQDSYGQSQQQSQSQNGGDEFFGTSEEDILDEEDDAEEQDGGPVNIIDGTEEDEDYTDSETSDYDDSQDSYDEADGSVDMGDSWNPDASFDYEASQEKNGASQSFSFSGSGFEPSGSITMEQSAGGEQQYFEASF